jgi:aldehyde dehydrogenase
VLVTSFDGYDDGIAIANDTLYGLGQVWSRNNNVALPGEGVTSGTGRVILNPATSAPTRGNSFR